MSKERVNKWPGTSVGSPGPVATIIRFTLTPEVCRLLLAEARSVFAWSQPELPDDLTFYSEGRPWFTTVGHEGQWDIDATAVGAAALKATLPNLRFWEG